MSGRGILNALLLGLAFWAVIALVFCASQVLALDYELWAERPGAQLRADEPNVKRIGQAFPSYHDCLEAVALSRAEKGWRLRCRPVDRAPVPRLTKADK